MNKKLVNIIGFLVLLILSVVLVSSFFKSIKRIREGDAIIEKTKVKLEKLNEENKKLEEQLKITQSEEFVEKQLRNKLGLAKEGEIVLVLPDNETLKKLAPVIPDEEEVTLKPNWKKWIDLFK
ncbi:hypothetical protein A2422_00495 [Candidatus Woesebacteria bacterium RIFOXYC1_FULL_31_51]|nr:MAG: Cell division protein DivIC (FtsB), stabilizes FtsL against RasP cleavage [Candidatus Woesebacteria bacterium GW2011_GWF1_31_35]KKP23128.1 MAG: Septum formation initiator [Candidatus Woesebacteria bacterium GW2011_GWC1_30_29]KKP26816.1 MAG: Septum formation initiator [Candidatus Woesebacteria bacterium GW2011_GWD1_31_12]KKP27391.1 MAG: Septum formation initiator [Candidatus Woesebacteria bacterium GW2011_GWB1_31_29]KKP33757.1 MAG: Septum formation initiator [Candidatus Woesebacteria bac